MKIALAYQRSIGQGTRYRLIGRARAYHGVNFGGISVGGIVGNRRQFIGLPGVDHLPHTHNLAEQAFTRGQPDGVRISPTRWRIWSTSTARRPSRQ